MKIAGFPNIFVTKTSRQTRGGAATRGQTQGQAPATRGNTRGGKDD